MISLYSRVAMLFCIGSALFAQEFRATVTGHVIDQSGAAIPQAAVTITNVGTNETISATTDAGGAYTLPLLTPGNYTLNAQAPGFKKYVQEKVVLNVGDTVGIDVQMQVGQATESITVSAETPVLQTENADRGLVIDQTRVSQLPLNARNPYMLSNLSAGVNFNGNIIYQRPFDNGAIADWSVNGGLDRKNEFLLDGAPNNAQAGANNIALVPPVDSVQEFKVQINSYDAAYGKSAGGIVNVTTKSGTNQYHGTGYEFMRRNAWDANSFQNNSQGKPKSGHYLDQYGGAIGGPLTIPKVYNGHDRSFFFFNYEGYRELTPTPLTVSVPSPEMLNGDFSKLTDANGNRITIYNPYSAVVNPTTGAVTRTPFPNNMIPSNLISPTGLAMLKLYPAPNTTTVGSGYSQNNYFVAGGANPDEDHFYNYVFRFDQNFGTSNHVFFRNASNDRTERRNSNGVTGVGWQGPDPLKRINDAYALDWTSTVTPTLVTDVRLSFSRYVEGSRSDTDLAVTPTAAGFSQSLVSQLAHPEQFGIYTVTNYSTLGQTSNFNYTNTWALAGTVTKIVGPHSLNGGVDLRWIQYNVQNLGNNLAFTFNNTWTQARYNQADSSSGNSIASMLLGLPTTGTVDNLVQPSYRDRYFAPYFKDDWKLSRKLTLNLGVRWDFFPTATERYNRLTRGFDPGVINPVNAAVQSNLPGFPTIKGGLVFAKPGQGNQRLDWTGIQPRFGLAYQVNDKLVFRGGYGRFMINPTNDNFRSEGYSVTSQLTSSLNNGVTPASANILANPYPNGLLQPGGSSLGYQAYLGQTLPFFDPNFHIPYAQMFSAGIQYQLPLHSRIEVSYVGNRANHLETYNYYNVIPLALRQQCDALEGGNGTICDAQVRNPFYNLPQFSGTSLGSSPTISRYQASLPFPQYLANFNSTASGMAQSVTQYGRNDGKLWYNGLQIAYSIRAEAGLNLTFAYTRSKTIEQGGYVSGLTSGGNDSEEAFNDIQKGVPERSVASYDRPNVFKVSTVYELPVGRGRKFMSGTSRWVDAVVGGWEHTMIFQYSTGIPWTLPTNTSYVRDAQQPINWSSGVVQGVRPCVAQMSETGVVTLESYSLQVPGCNLSNYNFLYNPLYAPSTTSLRDPSIRLDAKPQFDMSLAKTVRFNERMSFQFRAEAFNVFNTYWVQLQQFNNSITSANFGQIIKGTVGTGNSNYPRQIQLGFKFLF